MLYLFNLLFFCKFIYFGKNINKINNCISNIYHSKHKGLNRAFLISETINFWKIID